MNEEYILFRIVRDDMQLDLKINKVDLTIYELSEKFEEFVNAMGYHPKCIEEIFK